MAMLSTIDDLRRFAVGRNFFAPATLQRALNRMEFVQADPIRSPARAQDLILRHRVKNYHAGELERRYATLDIEEDVFVNYGFVTSSLQALMGKRETDEQGKRGKGKGEESRTRLLLELISERGAVHPREVDEHFSHGTVKNYWGGSSNATTRLLEEMHYRGLLRVVRREKGIRIYSAQHQPEAGKDSGLRTSATIDAAEHRARVDALVDVVVRIYAPLPGPSLSFYVRRLRYAAPQWQGELTAALLRARQRLSHARVDGTDWYWPNNYAVRSAPPDNVRLLAPFDPLVHDRARFELLWGWGYRFEAYTPVAKRKLGYYALPLLWRDRVIGWGNLSVKDGQLEANLGYVKSQPGDRVFKRELDAELNRMRVFLAV